MKQVFFLLLIICSFYNHSIASGYYKNGKQYLYVGDSDNVIDCRVGQLCDISLAPNDAFSSWVMTNGDVWSQSANAKINFLDSDGINHVILQSTGISSDNPVIMLGTTYQYRFNLKAVKSSRTNKYVFLVRKNNSYDASNAEIDSISLDFKGKKLDSKYYTEGDTDSEIMPVKIFNDGAKTYIEMPKNINVADLPTVYTFNNSGTLEQVNNARYRQPYFVIDGVLRRYALVSGSVDNDNQLRISIYRGKRPLVNHWFFKSYNRN
ncbi:MAG: TrbG/VirB9 family P-type conjugative transfer protein [Neisseriaceae bacterium]|jgi:type IV secretory pathway VirB9-like protein